MYGEEHVCPVCGEIFVAFRHVVYCSKRCRKKAYRKRSASRKKIEFETRICEVCGKPFTPKTPNQHTCGGDCTATYIAQKYGRRADRAVDHDQIPPGAFYEKYETSLLEWLEMSKTNLKQHQVAVECRKSFIDDLEPSLGQSANRMQLVQKALTSAKELDANFPLWREMPMHRQEALLNLAVGIGVQKLIQRDDIREAIQNQRWTTFKSLILCLAWAQANPRRAVTMCKRLESSF